MAVKSYSREELAQISDKELDDYIKGPQELLLDAIRERTYRTDKKLIKLSQNLLYYTIALFILTLALLCIEIKDVFFAKISGERNNQSELNAQGKNQ
jgi:hypothetical protein